MEEGSFQRAVTLREVAKNAGVSISTVSRILDDRTPTSHSETAQRVRRIAAELGYRRNSAASGLRRGATGTLGVLVPRLTDTVMALMFEAIERDAHHRGIFAMVATCGDETPDEEKAVETLLDRNVDGVILATARIADPLLVSLRARHVPHALVLRTDGVSPSALGDDHLGGYLAVRHLTDLGHRRVGVIAGPEFTSSARDRVRGAREAMRDAGLYQADCAVIHTGYGVDHGARATSRMLESSAPTAIFAANDNLALGAMSLGFQRGLAIGRDLSIVGYNDIPIAQQLPIPLSSVRVPFDSIASSALDLLLTSSDTSAMALPSLIPRASSGRPTD